MWRGGLVPAARRRKFTLVELTVVISIIGTLLAPILPAVQKSREASRSVHHRQPLGQLELALHAYSATHYVLPAGSIVQGPSFPVLSGWGWVGAMLPPYIDQSPLEGRLDFDLRTCRTRG